MVADAWEIEAEGYVALRLSVVAQVNGRRLAFFPNMITGITCRCRYVLHAAPAYVRKTYGTISCTQCGEAARAAPVHDDIFTLTAAADMELKIHMLVNIVNTWASAFMDPLQSALVAHEAVPLWQRACALDLEPDRWLADEKMS